MRQEQSVKAEGMKKGIPSSQAVGPRRVGTGMPPTGVGIDHRNPASTPLLARTFGGQGLPKEPRPQPQPP